MGSGKVPRKNSQPMKLMRSPINTRISIVENQVAAKRRQAISYVTMAPTAPARPELMVVGMSKYA